MPWLEACLVRLSRARRLQLALTLVGFAFCVIGFKWGALITWGSDVPFWDEWGVVAVRVLVPWHNGNLDWGNIFLVPHNEHWLAWTQLWSLALTALNGQWDPLFIATCNAVVHAAIGAFLLYRLWPVLHGVARVLAPAALVWLLASPITWENTLHAFQVQFYFLLAAALVHVAFTAVSPAGSGRWWVGMGAGLLGLGTMASSFLAPVAVITVRLMRAWHGRRWTSGDTVTVVACAALAAAGYALVNPMPPHEPLHAQGVGDFTVALTRILAFPFLDAPLLAVVMQAPLLWWTWRRVRQIRRHVTDGEWFFLGLVAWLFFQVGALAYARANYGGAVASRYLDLTGLLLVANAAALGMLWPDNRPDLQQARSLPLAVWVAVAVFGFLLQSQHQQHRFLSPMPGLWASRAARIQEFVVNGNEEPLLAAPPAEVAGPGATALIDHLRDPALRALLPASVRAPVPFTVETAHGFLPGSSPAISLPPTASEVWHSVGEMSSTWRSAPIAAEDLLPILRITFAGAPQLENSALRLVADDGREAPLEISGFAGTGWQSAHLFIPRGARSVQLVAEAGPDGHWLTFTLPVEVGMGSWIARTARKQNTVLAAVGAALFAFGLFISFNRQTILDSDGGRAGDTAKGRPRK